MLVLRWDAVVKQDDIRGGGGGGMVGIIETAVSGGEFGSGEIVGGKATVEGVEEESEIFIEVMV